MFGRTRFATGKVASMATTLRRFIADESGATAIEYGLIAALVAVAAIAALQAMGNSLSDMFNAVSGKLSGAAS